MYWMVAAVVVDGFVMALNIIELMLLLRRWKRLDRIEHILFSLCVADLICGIAMFGQDTYQLRAIALNLPLDITTTESLILECLIIFFILVSHFHVTAVAIERIFAVSMPMRYTVFTTNSCKILTISLVWVIALIIAPILTSTSKAYQSGQYVLASAIIICCTLVFFSYMALVVLLIRRERTMRSLLEPEFKRQLRDRRTTIFCLVFGFSFLICMLPYAIGLLQQSLFHETQILLLTAYHLVNPIVYFVKYYFNGRGRSNTITSNSKMSHNNLLNRSPLTTRSTFIMHGDSTNSFKA
ncbi:adenosine receptor A3-like [Clytia hemisphaerica]